MAKQENLGRWKRKDTEAGNDGHLQGTLHPGAIVTVNSIVDKTDGKGGTYPLVEFSGYETHPDNFRKHFKPLSLGARFKFWNERRKHPTKRKR